MPSTKNTNTRTWTRCSTPSTKRLMADDATLASKTAKRSFARRAIRILTPFAIAYTLVVAGMIFLETLLVYPIPPLAYGNWHPVGLDHEEVAFNSADGTKL